MVSLHGCVLHAARLHVITDTLLSKNDVARVTWAEIVEDTDLLEDLDEKKPSARPGVRGAYH